MLTIIGAELARGLELRTRFDQLLPDDQPSVLELKRLSERTAGSSSIFVVLEGGDRDTLRALGARLLPPLRAVGPPWVVSAEDGVQVARDFLLPRSGLFASVEDLQKLNKELDTQRKKAVGKALSLGLEDDEEEQKAPSFAELKDKFLGGKSATLEAAKDRYPDGYFQSKDGKTLVVLVRTGITTGELERSREALAKVKEVTEKTLPDAPGQGGHVRLRRGPGHRPLRVRRGARRPGPRRDHRGRGHPGRHLHLLPPVPGAGSDGGHDVRRTDLHLRAHPAGHRPPQRHHRLPGVDHRRERDQLRHPLRGPLPRGASARVGPRDRHQASRTSRPGWGRSPPPSPPPPPTEAWRSLSSTASSTSPSSAPPGCCSAGRRPTSSLRRC